MRTAWLRWRGKGRPSGKKNQRGSLGWIGGGFNWIDSLFNEDWDPPWLLCPRVINDRSPLQPVGRAEQEPFDLQRSYYQAGRAPNGILFHVWLLLQQTRAEPRFQSQEEPEPTTVGTISTATHPCPQTLPTGTTEPPVALFTWNEQVWFEQQTSSLKDCFPLPVRTANTVHFAIVPQFSLLLPQTYIRVGAEQAFIKFLCLWIISSNVVMNVSF